MRWQGQALVFVKFSWPRKAGWSVTLVWGFLVVRGYDIFYLFHTAGVWLLFNGGLTLLSSLLYVIRQFDRFFHR